MSRPTLSELRWPMDDESHRQAVEWAEGITTQVLEWTWRAFDLLGVSVLSHVDMTQSLEQLERDLTGNHFAEIQGVWARETEGETSIEPWPEYAELETRAPAPAKPPAYDIAFVWRANRRIAFPIEAKVVKTPSALADYLGDTDKFVSGIAAPWVGEGAQIAYLLKGDSSIFFTNLKSRLRRRLEPVSDFLHRPHRVSRHKRTKSPLLHLHHLVMHLNTRDDAASEAEQLQLTGEGFS
jgi:hypothetical protein